jgi:hypothetical protein
VSVINEAENNVADIDMEELIAVFTAAAGRCDAASEDVVRAQAGGALCVRLKWDARG